MKDNMKEKDLTVDFFFGNEEINPFDAPQMCVVRRLSNAYHELENEKLPATVRQKEDGRYELVSGHRRKK